MIQKCISVCFSLVLQVPSSANTTISPLTPCVNQQNVLLPAQDIFAIGPPCQPFSRLSSRKLRDGYNPFDEAGAEPFLLVSRYIRASAAVGVGCFMETGQQIVGSVFISLQFAVCSMQLVRFSRLPLMLIRLISSRLLAIGLRRPRRPRRLIWGGSAMSPAKGESGQDLWFWRRRLG